MATWQPRMKGAVALRVMEVFVSATGMESNSSAMGPTCATGTPTVPTSPPRLWGIRVAAELGAEVEGDRQAGLALVEVGPVVGVRGRGRGVPRVSPHHPGPSGGAIAPLSAPAGAARPCPGGSTRSARQSEGGVQVLEQVVDGLEARPTSRISEGSTSSSDPATEEWVILRRQLDQRLDGAEGLGEREQPRACGHLHGGGLAAGAG